MKLISVRYSLNTILHKRSFSSGSSRALVLIILAPSTPVLTEVAPGLLEDARILGRNSFAIKKKIV